MSVVEFPTKGVEPAEKMYFLCPCNCRSFEICEDGTIECCNCGRVNAAHVFSPDEQEGHSLHTEENIKERLGEWVKRLPPLPEDRESAGDEGGTMRVTVSNTGSVDFAQRLTMRWLNDWMKEGKLSILVGYNSEGEGKHWLNISTQNQKDWVLEKLQALMEFTRALKVEPDDNEPDDTKPDDNEPDQKPSVGEATDSP